MSERALATLHRPRPPGMDLGWRRCQPAPGERPYFFNVVFQTTQWDLPAGLSEADVPEFSETDEAAAAEEPGASELVLPDVVAAQPVALPSAGAPATLVEAANAATSDADAGAGREGPETPTFFAEYEAFPPAFRPRLHHPALPAVCSRGIGDLTCPADLAWEARSLPSSGNESGEVYFINPRTGAQSWEAPPAVRAVAETQRVVRRDARRSPARAALEDIAALDARGALADPLLLHAAVLQAHNAVAEAASRGGAGPAAEAIVPCVLPFLCRLLRPGEAHPATARLAARALRAAALITPAAFLDCVADGGAASGGGVSPAELVLCCAAGAAAAFGGHSSSGGGSSVDGSLLSDWLSLLAVAALRFGECCGAAASTAGSLGASATHAARIRESLSEDAFPWDAVARAVLSRSHEGGPATLAVGVAALAGLHRLFEVCHVGASDDVDAGRPGAGAASARVAADSQGVITPLVEAAVQRGVVRSAADLLPADSPLLARQTTATPAAAGGAADSSSPARAARGAVSAALSCALVEALADPAAVLAPPLTERIDEGAPGARYAAAGFSVEATPAKAPPREPEDAEATASGAAAADSVPGIFAAINLGRRLVAAELSLLRAVLELAAVLHGSAAPALYVNDLRCLVDLILREVGDLSVADVLRVPWLLTLRTLLLKSQWFDPSGGARYRAADLAAILNGLFDAQSQAAGLPPLVREVTEDILCGEARSLLED